MNQRSLRSLQGILKQMERESRRPGGRGQGRFSTSPLVLTAGLVLANVLLTWLVPAIWDSLLPHGLEDVGGFEGWPGLLWRGVLISRGRQGAVRGTIAVVCVLSFILGYRSRAIRILVWILALGVILLNAGILYVTLHTSLNVNAASIGLEL